MLQQIKLQNFRRFREATLDFVSGITLVNGANGVGKSTIIESIEWGFYGKTKKDTLLSSIRNANSPEDSEVKVSILFSFNNTQYLLERVLTPKNSTTAIVTNPEDKNIIHAKGTKGVNEFITTLFGINHQAFITSFIAPQKEIDALSSFKNEERKQFFIKLLGLEILDKIKPEVRRDVRESKNTLSLLKGQLPDISQLKKDLKEIEKELKDNEKNKTLLDKAYSTMEEKNKKHKEKLATLEENYRTFLKLKEQIKYAEKEQHELTLKKEENLRTIERLAPLENEKIDIENLDEKINQLEKERDDYRRLAQYEDAIRESRQRVKALKQDIETKKQLQERLLSELPKEISNLKEVQNIYLQKSEFLAQLKGQLKVAEQEHEEIKRLLDNINEGAISRCPTCYTDFTNSEESLNYIKQKQKKDSKSIMSLQFQISDLEDEIKRISDKIKKLEQQKTIYDDVISQINTQKALVTNLEKQLKDAVEKRDKSEDKVKDIDTSKYQFKNLFDTEQELKKRKIIRQQVLEIIKKLNELSTKREENSRIETTLKELADSLSNYAEEELKLNFKESDYENAKQKMSEYDKLLAQSREEIIRSSADKKILENNKQNKEQEIVKAEKIKKDVEKYREHIVVNTLVDEIMTSLRLDLANRITPKLGEYTSNYLRDITDGLYQNVLIDENYNINVLVDDEEWPLSQFSGGEQDVINLCMRLAISQIILEAKNVPYNMMILDEIFGSQDDERKMAIIDVIGHLKSIFPQIILITHINEVKDKADHIINVVKDEEGNSHIVA